jgi:photosynthetic reaction center H subunit
MFNEFTSRVDLAQVVLYAFWGFFFSLIYWLRREDRREGYPLDRDTSATAPLLGTDFLIPAPKTFLLPHDEGTVLAPRIEAPSEALLTLPRPGGLGLPIDPSGDPLLSNVGPASYANRSDKADKTREGHDLIVPMRIAEGFAVSAGPDPRGWDVVATDGKVAGKVKDLWVDRADVMVRYVEVELDGESAGTRLLPITMLLLHSEPRQVAVHAIRSEHFASVPTLKEPDRVTVLEEERICAFYAGGRRYAEPSRLGPLV